MNFSGDSGLFFLQLRVWGPEENKSKKKNVKFIKREKKNLGTLKQNIASMYSILSYYSAVIPTVNN